MPRMEDIAKIWRPWAPIKADLEAHGYQPGATSVDEAVADQRSALSTTCPECGHHCNYAGFNKGMRSYRSYIVCLLCNIGHRLS